MNGNGNGSFENSSRGPGDSALAANIRSESASLRAWWRENVRDPHDEIGIARRWGLRPPQLRAILEGREDCSLETAFKISEDTGISLLKLRGELVKVQLEKAPAIESKTYMQLENEINHLKATQSISLSGAYSQADINKHGWLELRAHGLDYTFPGGVNFSHIIDTGIIIPAPMSVDVLVRPYIFTQGTYMASSYLDPAHRLLVNVIRLTGPGAHTIKQGSRFAFAKFCRNGLEIKFTTTNAAVRKIPGLGGSY